MLEVDEAEGRVGIVVGTPTEGGAGILLLLVLGLVIELVDDVVLLLLVEFIDTDKGA